MKICSTCKKEFSATKEYFYVDARRKSGLKSQCKACVKLYYEKKKASEHSKEYQKEYREQHREQAKEYREQHKNEVKGATEMKVRRTEMLSICGTDHKENGLTPEIIRASANEINENLQKIKDSIINVNTLAELFGSLEKVDEETLLQIELVPRRYEYLAKLIAKGQTEKKDTLTLAAIRKLLEE